MQLKTSKKKKNLINEVRTFSNEYFSFNNIDNNNNNIHSSFHYKRTK